MIVENIYYKPEQKKKSKKVRNTLHYTLIEKIRNLSISIRSFSKTFSYLFLETLETSKNRR